MTLPFERKRALHMAKEFMRDLLDSARTKRVPSEIRKEARYRLKHYPSHYDIDDLAKASPQLLGDELNAEDYLDDMLKRLPAKTTKKRNR